MDKNEIESRERNVFIREAILVQLTLSVNICDWLISNTAHLTPTFYALYLEIPVEATMPLSSECIGIVTGKGHDVNWSCVVCHTDPTFRSVLCVVVCYHQ